jgi:type IV fimbrial biogenesis protein FimT
MTCACRPGNPLKNDMRQGSLGFTLVELMITLALTAIVLVLGVPAMRDMIQNNRQAVGINDILVSLNLARAEAVRRGAATVMCISDGADPPDCDSASNAWEDGWILFVDGDNDGTTGGLDANGDEDWDRGEDWLLRAHAALSEGTTLRGNTNVARTIRYNPRGFSGSAGTLRLCDSRGPEAARGVVISNTGRPRRAIDSGDADEIVEDGSRSNLTCP